MRKRVRTIDAQRWDEVNGIQAESGGMLESPEEQAEGPELVNPLDDNPLKNAEMAVEDDYDSIDGIINNGSKREIEDEILEEQKSVMDKIHEHEEKIKQLDQVNEPEKIKKDMLCPDRNLC